MAGQSYNSGNYEQPNSDCSEHHSEEQLAAYLGLSWSPQAATATRPVLGPIAITQHMPAVGQWTPSPGSDDPPVPAIDSAVSGYQTTTNPTNFGAEVQGGAVAGAVPSSMTDLGSNLEYANLDGQADTGYADSTYNSPDVCAPGVCAPGTGSFGGWAGPTQSGYGGFPTTGYSGDAARSLQMPATPLSNVAVGGPSVNSAQGEVRTEGEGLQGWHGPQTPAASGDLACGQIAPQSSSQAGTYRSDHARSRHHGKLAKLSHRSVHTTPYDRPGPSHHKSGNEQSVELNAARHPAVSESLTVYEAPPADTNNIREAAAMLATDPAIGPLDPNHSFYMYDIVSPAGAAAAFDATSSASAPVLGMSPAPMSSLCPYGYASAPIQLSAARPLAAIPPTSFGSHYEQRLREWTRGAYCSWPESHDEKEALRANNCRDFQKRNLIKKAKVAIRDSVYYRERGYEDWTEYVESGNPRSTTGLVLLVNKLRKELGNLQRTDSTIYDNLSLEVTFDEERGNVGLEAWKPAAIETVKVVTGKRTERVAEREDGGAAELVAQAQVKFESVFPVARTIGGTQPYAGSYVYEVQPYAMPDPDHF